MSTSSTNEPARWRAGAALVGGGLLAGLLLAGIVLLLVGRFTSGGQAGASAATTRPTAAPTGGTSTPAGGGQAGVLAAAENKIAARPMLKGQGTSRQVEANPTTRPMVLPKSTRMAGGLVPSGFPMTPAGAVAQLAALNQVAYHNFSVDQGRQAYEAFAIPGAVPIDEFIPTANVMDYYQQYSFADPSQITASYTPVQGLVKGTANGGRWVLACTIGRVTYAQNNESNTEGAPDCERMQWSGDRWMLAPGPRPAMPTLTWPRSADSYKAGFRDLRGVSF